MGSIAIKLNPEKLSNPDLDVRYSTTEKIEELTFGKITNNGYDYLADEVSSLVIFLNSSNPVEDVIFVVEVLKNNSFNGNQLYEAAEVFFSDKPNEELEACDYDLSVYEQYQKIRT